MPMYNLFEYNDNYSKTSGSFLRYYRDEPNVILTNSQNQHKTLNKLTRKTPTDANPEVVEIAVQLKYINNFWRKLEMPIISCEINLILTWSADCVYFATSDIKYYVPFMTLSTQIMQNY